MQNKCIITYMYMALIVFFKKNTTNFAELLGCF